MGIVRLATGERYSACIFGENPAYKFGSIGSLEDVVECRDGAGRREVTPRSVVIFGGPTRGRERGQELGGMTTGMRQ